MSDVSDGEYPLCACGCGEHVPVGLHAQRIVSLHHMVWFLPGHAPKGAAHNRPYADERNSEAKL